MLTFQLLVNASSLRHFQKISIRTLFRPPPDWPYRGIYRTDGETVKLDDILVCQIQNNYHPGLNVSSENDRKHKLLRACCDGRVMITNELTNPDWTNPDVLAQYGHRKSQPLYKLTFNVIPFDMPRSFKLVDEI